MQEKAHSLKKRSDSHFFKKGLIIAILSGMTYGLYTGFVTLGMSKGIWGSDWYGANMSGLSVFAITYVLAALGCAVNDFVSAIWMVIKCVYLGEFKDFLSVLKTKPAWVMIVLAIIGGPIASTCYIAAIQLAGPVSVPFAALNAAIGAMIGHFAFKQELNKRMVLGIIICFLSVSVIGGTTFDGFGTTTMLGICLALVCSIGWGIEGAVGGFGTVLIDYNVGITIRQCTSAIGNICVLLPILCLIDGNGLNPVNLFSTALFDSSILIFLISGLFSGLSFGFWYKGASMCGAALCMTCNCAYAFWGPLFTWIICGLIDGGVGYGMTPIQWIFAGVMIGGIALVGDLNPLNLIRKKTNKEEAAT